MQCYIDALFILYKWPLFQLSENRSTLRPYLIFSCIMILISVVNEICISCMVYSIQTLQVSLLFFKHSNPVHTL